MLQGSCPALALITLTFKLLSGLFSRRVCVFVPCGNVQKSMASKTKGTDIFAAAAVVGMAAVAGGGTRPRVDDAGPSVVDLSLMRVLELARRYSEKSRS